MPLDNTVDEGCREIESIPGAVCYKAIAGSCRWDIGEEALKGEVKLLEVPPIGWSEELDLDGEI